MFDDGAASTPAQSSSDPMIVKDGTMTAYLYPVSTGTEAFETNIDKHTLRVTRSWAAADELGSLHVLSYLVVFRPTGQPAPSVSDLKLQSADKGAEVMAQVEGSSLSLSFQN